MSEIKTPSISVSQHDMYRTRENEGEGICDNCPCIDMGCTKNPTDCENDLRELAEWQAVDDFLHEDREVRIRGL